MRRFSILLPILVFCLFATNVFASNSLIHETTDKVDPARSSVQTHFDKNAWIYTKLDDTGYTQVYYQYLDTSVTTPDLLDEVRLTNTPFHKSLAQWGAHTERLDIYQTTGSSSLVETCSDGQLFYYLGDSDGNKKNEIHVGCFTNFLSTTPVIRLDTKLTEWNTASTFDIVQFDVHHEDSATIYRTLTPTIPRSAYPVVFTTQAWGELHFLMHSAQRINLDATNLTDQLIVIDYTDPLSIYDWQTFVGSHLFRRYESASFDVYGNNIIYLGKLPMGTRFELGTIRTTGDMEQQLTAFNTEISNPRFHDTQTNSLPHDIVNDIFFTYTRGPNRIGHLKTQTTDGGTFQWCSQAKLITPDDHSRQNYRTKFIEPGTGTQAGNTFVVYERTQDDGLNDIYQKDLELPSCTTGWVTTPINTIGDLNHTKEKQLTCMQDNTFPAILPDIFYDEFFAPFPHSPKGFTDIVFSRDYTDGTGATIGHIYNVENTTAECAETCFETASGAPIVDSNGFEDGDGFADWCEEIPEEVIPPPKKAPEETSSTTTSGYFKGDEPPVDEPPTDEPPAVLIPPDVDPTTQESPPLDGSWLFSGSSCSLASSPVKTDLSFLFLILTSLLGMGFLRLAQKRK